MFTAEQIKEGFTHVYTVCDIGIQQQTKTEKETELH